MSEKEFDFQEEFPSLDSEPALETPEEIQAESEVEEVREVTLAFPENEAWPPQPESQEPSEIVPPPPNARNLSLSVKTYSEAEEDLRKGEPEVEAVEQRPVHIYNGKPANSSSQSFGGVINGTKLDGFLFYTIKHPTGITLNGKHFKRGSYWFDQATFEGIQNIDAPFQ